MISGLTPGLGIPRVFVRPRAFALVGAICLIGALGCRDDREAGTSAKPGPPAGPRLRLLVVDDEALARSITALRAEWHAQTGGEFDLRSISRAEFEGLGALAEDAAIIPSGALGTAAERGWVEPLPTTAVKSPSLAWQDVFETLALREACWAGKPMAIPFGSPALVLWYRPDLFEATHRRPPTTWTEYQALAEFFSARENLGSLAPAADAAWAGTLEPRGAGWSGRLLLARAAAYCLQRDAYSTYFNIDTVEPLIDSPPFSRALEELVAIEKSAAIEKLAGRLTDQGGGSAAPVGAAAGGVAFDPEQVRREFLAGRAAMALSWPSAAAAPSGADAGPTAPHGAPTIAAVAFAPLPGSDVVYNRAGKRWDRRAKDDSASVTLTGVAGRLGVVSQASFHPDETRSLLAWLSTTWGIRVASASPATTIFRHSQLRKPEPWVDAGIPAVAARQYAQTLDDCLSRPSASLTSPRIPGEEEYLAALDEAVASALAGQASPAAALRAAAARWDAITNRLGRQAQRAAYRRSLGLEP